MKLVVALVLAVAGTFAVAQPSTAQVSVRISTPTVHRDGGEALVRGRAYGPVRQVKVQKRLSGHWVTVQYAAVRQGSYATRLRVSTRTSTTLRTAYSRTASPAVTLRPVLNDACGARPKKADGTLWGCTFVDNFNDTALDRAKWAPQQQFASGVPGAHACYVDDPSVIEESGGSLNLTVRQVAEPVSCTFGSLTGPTRYIAGGVMTYRLFSQQYGRFEARYRTTASGYQGLHEAFWLWPDDRVAATTAWPMSGEIDIAENYSYHPELAIPFLHYGYGLPVMPTVNTAWNCVAPRGVFNTYTLVWSASRIEILVNGRTCLVNTSGDEAFKKAYIVALTQGLGAAGNEYDGRAPLPATMNVDYVKVWK